MDEDFREEYLDYDIQRQLELESSSFLFFQSNPDKRNRMCLSKSVVYKLNFFEVQLGAIMRKDRSEF